VYTLKRVNQPENERDKDNHFWADLNCRLSMQLKKEKKVILTGAAR
jgi:hypothetical protein